MAVLSVVPIFMNAGAAVLPTLVAPIATVVGLLFKPRELVRVCRERPVTAGISVAAVAAVSFGIWFLLSDSPAQAKAAKAPAAVQIDWAKVAQDIIEYGAAQDVRKAQEAQAKAADDKARMMMAWLLHGWPTSVDASSSSTGSVSSTPAAGDGGASSSDPPVHSGAAIVVGHDYSRCSYSGGASPRELIPLWTFRLDDTMFLSVPVVSGKRVYVAGCTYDQKLIGVLACLDADNGKPIWQIVDVGGEVLQPFFSSPALTADGKNLIIGGGLHEDHDCSLRCFNPETGEQRWAVKTSLHIESSPAILGDMVVVGCGAIEDASGKATGDPGHVIAVRISDGKLLWRQPVNDPESTPAIDNDGMVYIGSGFNGNAVVALRSGTDEELRSRGQERLAWRTPVSQPVTCDITLAGDLVIAGAGNSDFVNAHPHPEGFVTALDRKTGKVRWETKFADAVLGQISQLDGKLYCPVRTGEVAVLDLADGHILWRTPISGKAPVMAGCAVTGKLIYAVSSDGYLGIIDPNNHTVVEKVNLNDQAKAGTGKSLCSPQVVNGCVIVGSETGGLRCYVGKKSQ